MISWLRVVFRSEEARRYQGHRGKCAPLLKKARLPRLAKRTVARSQRISAPVTQFSGVCRFG